MDDLDRWVQSHQSIFYLIFIIRGLEIEGPLIMSVTSNKSNAKNLGLLKITALVHCSRTRGVVMRYYDLKSKT